MPKLRGIRKCEAGEGRSLHLRKLPRNSQLEKQVLIVKESAGKNSNPQAEFDMNFWILKS